jgi:asparagine synthase (glutamine-hydrolysing)
MAAAEAADASYDTPKFKSEKDEKPDENQPSDTKEESKPESETAENSQDSAEAKPETEAEAPVVDDGSEPAIAEDDQDDNQPPVEEEKKEEYINISNPEDKEIYEAPRKPSTPNEKVQMAIDDIEKRSKFLDEPNVISDEAVDNIVNSINFYDDEE